MTSFKTIDVFYHFYVWTCLFFIKVNILHTVQHLKHSRNLFLKRRSMSFHYNPDPLKPYFAGVQYATGGRDGIHVTVLQI